MEAASLVELFTQEKERIIQHCDLCGICVEACPAIPLTPLASATPSDIQAKVMDVLKDATMSEEAAIRAASCMHCATCVGTCPQDLNPVILQEILQFEMVKLGQRRYPMGEIKLGDRICLLPEVLGSMQIKPGEKRWLTQVPDNPPQKDFVVFTGCAMVGMPDKIFLVADILERLKLDFVMVTGGELLCCGARYLGVSLEKTEAYGRVLVAALGAFKPRKVIFCCAECAYRVAQYYQRILSVPFEHEELFHFLSKHVDELEFSQPVNKRVTLHDPCSIARIHGDTESLRRLLAAIPGLQLVEMKRHKEQTICCGLVASRLFPQVGLEMARQCIEEAARTGAEVLVDACQGCHLQLCPHERGYPLEIQNCLTIIGEAMGISYEDKIKKFIRYGDADKILAEARENIEASPYDFDQVEHLAKRFFKGPNH